MGVKSLAKLAWRRFRVPVEVMALPKRYTRISFRLFEENEDYVNIGELLELTAVRVGHTQSNISAPRATETTRSSG